MVGAFCQDKPDWSKLSRPSYYRGFSISAALMTHALVSTRNLGNAWLVHEADTEASCNENPTELGQEKAWLPRRLAISRFYTCQRFHRLSGRVPGGVPRGHSPCPWVQGSVHL